MKGVFLDFDTLKPEDLNLDKFNNSLEAWNLYGMTQAAETLSRIEDAEIVVSNKVVLSREILEKSTSLKLICIAATGVNNVDLEAAKELGVEVRNVQGYARNSVVQHTMAMMLALSTRIFQQTEGVKAGEWQKAPFFTILDHAGFELAGKTLGIIGYGNLGQGVAEIARAFGMKVIISARKGNVQEGRIAFDEVLSQSDFLSLHCPLTEETRDLITLEDLKKMKQDACLINTARGGVVNEQDLALALKEGIIAAAAVDVLSQEPPVNGNPLLEKDVPNLLLTPHTAWSSREARQIMVDQLAENIQSFFEGGDLNKIV